MYFKQFLHDDNGCASYFLASRQSREAAVIDPQLIIQPYLDLAHERHYTITHVIDTYLHADHVSGNRALRDATGAQLFLQADAEVVFPFTPLRDGDEIHIGQIVVTVVHTPGHRPESMCLLVTNPPRSPEPSMVLSGDTLFVGDVGRPDFGGPEGAATQYESVQRLLRLDDYVEVFPAHFEGACGKGMCGRPSTTIGFERRFNPILQLPRDAFVQQASDVSARPLNMSAIIATNRGVSDLAWAMPHDQPEVEEVDVRQASDWLASHDALVVDVREPAEYDEGHLPGAILIPQADLSMRLDELPNDRSMLVVCAGGTRSLRAAGFLKQLGYTDVASLAGGTSAWRRAQKPIE